MFAFVPNSAEVGDYISNVKTYPPRNTGVFLSNGYVIATSLRQLAINEEYELLASIGWHLVDDSAVDPGETATHTRDVRYVLTNDAPIEVTQQYNVRPKTQEEIDRATEEQETETRRLNLGNILTVLDNRSQQHQTWADMADGVTVNSNNRDAVLQGMVDRQAVADGWFSQLYNRLGDLIRFVGINNG